MLFVSNVDSGKESYVVNGSYGGDDGAYGGDDGA
jgi:hypothetical protein